MLKPITSESLFQRDLWRILPVIVLMFAGGAFTHSQAKNTEPVKNIALVHGGFVNGSGWEGVYKILTKKGFTFTIVQNPTISFADDVAVTKRAIAALDSPVILVGHSYGGMVISQVGSDPKVAGLVFIAAFAPDNGESVCSLIKNPPPGAPAAPDSAATGLFLVPRPRKSSSIFCG
jgi:pimeloyl-ACP methyl ester carboxylesterase